MTTPFGGNSTIYPVISAPIRGRRPVFGLNHAEEIYEDEGRLEISLSTDSSFLAQVRRIMPAPQGLTRNVR